MPKHSDADFCEYASVQRKFIAFRKAKVIRLCLRRVLVTALVVREADVTKMQILL